VRVHHWSEEKDTPFFTMEYLSGGSLARCLAAQEDRRLPVRRAAELVLQVALGVQHVHENNVVHRDLKPANILLDDEGNARVADFGLAKVLNLDASQTLTGAVVGTAAYMAPEQAEGMGLPVGPVADVWALGVILYECLTGKAPFTGPTVWDTLAQVR